MKIIGAVFAVVVHLERGVGCVGRFAVRRSRCVDTVDWIIKRSEAPAELSKGWSVRAGADRGPPVAARPIFIV